MADGTISKIQLPDNTIYDVVDNTSGYMTGMTILSYGSSTWQNFIDAYSSNKVVYCRASSNSNPATGSQTRLAFMAYVNNATTPTEVEFQYYRSVSSHTASQQGDQVYVYKLNKTNGWSVTVREASVKVVAGTGLGGTYSNGTMTLTGPTKVSNLTNDSGFITLNDIPTTHSIPSGGTTGQILAKNSNTNYDVSWVDASAGAYIVTFIYDDVEDEWSCDKTAQQIYEAYQAGKIVLALNSEDSGICYLDTAYYNNSDNYYDINFSYFTTVSSNEESSNGYIDSGGFNLTSDGYIELKLVEGNFVHSSYGENWSAVIQPNHGEGGGNLYYQYIDQNKYYQAGIEYGIASYSNPLYSYLALLGDEVELRGKLCFLADDSNYAIKLDAPSSFSNNVNITLPATSGTVALTSDIVQSDWNQTVSTAKDYIKNKPTIPTKVSDLTNDSGFITGYTETDPIFSASAAAGIALTDISNWNNKQAALVSGTNIKTINNTSLLGSGNIDIQSTAQNVWYGTCPTSASTSTKIVTTTSGDFGGNVGDVLVVTFDDSLACADGLALRVDGTEYSLDNVAPTFDQRAEYGSVTTMTFVVSDDEDRTVSMIDNYIGLYAEYLEYNKQDTLVSGTNIKTINNQSILGSGDITVSTTAAQIIRWTEST